MRNNSNPKHKKPLSDPKTSVGHRAMPARRKWFSIGQSKTAQKNTIISVFLIGEKIKIEKIIVGNACPEHSKIPILHQSNSLMTFQHDFLLVDISIFVLQFNYEQAYFGECLMNFSAFLFQLFWIENVRWLVSESYKRRTCCRPKR